MNVKYTDREKEALGRVFKYLRVDNQKKTVDIIKNICSEKTYQIIEKGKIVRNNNFYNNLNNRFNMKFYSLERLFDWLDNFVTEFYHACDYMKMEVIEKCYCEQEKFFKIKKTAYSNAVIFFELILCFLIVLRVFHFLL